MPKIPTKFTVEELPDGMFEIAAYRSDDRYAHPQKYPTRLEANQALLVIYDKIIAMNQVVQ